MTSSPEQPGMTIFSLLNDGQMSRWGWFAPTSSTFVLTGVLGFEDDEQLEIWLVEDVSASHRWIQSKYLEVD